METNNHRHIFSGLGKTENRIQPKTSRFDGHPKANSEHLAKLFCSERVGGNTNEEKDQFTHTTIDYHSSIKSKLINVVYLSYSISELSKNDVEPSLTFYGPNNNVDIK